MQKTFVLVADFINEIVDENGAFGAHNAQRVKECRTMDNANKLIAWARRSNVSIGHVKVGFSENYNECSKVSPMFKLAPKNNVLKLNTWATEFHKNMDVQDSDVVITKHRVSVLYGTDLEVILRANNIEHVVICGVSTSYVVESTVRELHDRDYRVTVIADACNAATKESHEASLNNMARIANIIKLNDFVAS